MKDAEGNTYLQGSKKPKPDIFFVWQNFVLPPSPLKLPLEKNKNRGSFAFVHSQEFLGKNFLTTHVT
jgi:hypothetical protein